MKKLLIIFASLTVCVPALSWGGLEHTVIAYIAQDHLTENAERNLRYYLDQPIYEYAEWMDYKPIVRRPGFDIPRNGHSTAVDFDGTIPEITPFENGKGKGSCYRYLKEIVYTLQNHREMSDSFVIFHLRCFIHMMGDYHCPVHVHFFDIPKDGSSLPNSLYLKSEAATPVVFKGKDTDLHTVLDGSLRHIHGDWDYEQWKEELDVWDEAQIEEAVKGDVRDYLISSCRAAREIYDNARSGMSVDAEYFTGRTKEIIYQQIRCAAYRMAKIINDCFDYEN